MHSTLFYRRDSTSYFPDLSTSSGQFGIIRNTQNSLIYGTPTEQKCAILVCVFLTDGMRKQLQKIQDNLPPGGVNARTRADTAANTTNVFVED